MAYNPSWLQNMYMGKYETEDERLKRLQNESINNTVFGNSGAGAGLESILGDNPRSTFQPSYQSTNQTISKPLMQDAIDQGEFTGKSTAKATDTKSYTPSGSLGAADYVSLGLQLVGAMQADKEAKRLEEKADKKYNEELKRSTKQNARQREDELRQEQEQLQRQDRSMNMQGLEMLAKQRERAYSKRVSDSMANTFARAIRG